jgi:hypothetical protein
MFSKFGKKITPYSCTVVFPNIEGGVNGAWGAEATKNAYKYHYSMRNMASGELLYEREPKKSFMILNPSDYIGTLGL